MTLIIQAAGIAIVVVCCAVLALLAAIAISWIGIAVIPRRPCACQRGKTSKRPCACQRREARMRFLAERHSRSRQENARRIREARERTTA